MSTYNGLGVPLYGESQISQQTLGNDILTLTGVASQTGDFFVCENSSGTELFVVDKDGDVTVAATLAVGGRISQMVIGTVALASLASNASATVALSGMTTASAAGLFARGDQTGAVPVVWASAADKLGYGAPGVATAAQTVNIWYFTTA